MEYAFFFITVGFGGALLLYALLLWATRDLRLIPRHETVELKDPRGYAKTVAVMLAFLGLALLAGGWAAFFVGTAVGLIVTAVSLVLAIWLCVRLWRSDRNKNR